MDSDGSILTEYIPPEPHPPDLVQQMLRILVLPEAELFDPKVNVVHLIMIKIVFSYQCFRLHSYIIIIYLLLYYTYFHYLSLSMTDCCYRNMKREKQDEKKQNSKQ